MARRTMTELTTINPAALAILDYQPAQSIELSTSLVGMRAGIEAAAAANVQAAIQETGGQFSELEVQAMVTVESLKQVGGLELTAVLLRAMYLRIIQDNNMIGNHPGGYNSLAELANDNGISIAELSQTMDLVNIIFPYVQEQLGIPVAQLWEQVGKSNLREITPVLKVIISGVASDTGTTQAAVDHVLEDTTATLLASAHGARFLGMDQLPEAEQTGRREEFNATVRRMAVDNIVEDGIHLPNRQLRQQLRPQHTPMITGTVINNNGQRMVLASMDNDQWLLFVRQMGTHFEEHGWIVPEDPRQRQIEAARIAELRTLIALVRGEQ